MINIFKQQNSVNNIKKKFIFLLLLILCASASSAIFKTKKTLKIGIAGPPPFLMVHDKYYTGIIIDIWHIIAQINSFKYKYIHLTNVNQGIEDLAEKKYDILIGDFAFIPARAKKIDYTYPFFLTSTSILTLKNPLSSTSINKNFIARYFYLFIIILIIYFLCAYLYYKKELKTKYIKTEQKTKEKSLHYAMWLVITALIKGHVDKQPTTNQGRILILFIILLGIIFTGLVTAWFTSSAVLIEESSYERFTSTNSLHGKTFLVWGNDISSQEAIKENKAFSKIVPFNQNIYNFYMDNKTKYAGIIADLPVNNYIKENSENKNLYISSLTLGKELFGFMTYNKSPYLTLINHSLLLIRENGQLENICKQYLKEALQSCTI